MYYNTPNVIVDNILTEEEIAQVYKAVENNDGNTFVQVHCQLNNFITLPHSIIEKFTNHAKRISGNDNLVLNEFCHARYQNTTSNCGKFHFRPSLFPHYDETFKEPRFTFDYQLKANIDWPIVVEPNTHLSLKDNQAATFSGTHQIHWRVPTIFEDDQFVEMIFCHFFDPTEGLKGEDVNRIMDEKADKYKKEFFDNGGLSNG